jgi:hypothetical protein
MKEVNTKLSTFQTLISNQINTTNLWQSISYNFSPTLKHSDVKLISQNIVKATTNSGYKFSLMEPKIDLTRTKSYNFYIK